MKRIFIYCLLAAFLFISCKKDAVDASTTKSLQSSINDMASSLTTLQQIKFNEALYILKTFGAEGNNDVEKLKGLGQLINGKKVPEIFAMADQIAQQNEVDWSSTAPPSLGEMNIFDNEKPTEHDANDITASSLSLVTRPIQGDSASGAKALLVIPKLVDEKGQPIVFSGAALETQLEVFNNGVRLLSSKNLMTENNFKGFTVRYSSLPKNKILDDKIDVTVSVKTSKKTYKMSKIGIPINPNALYVPQEVVENPDGVDTEITDDGTGIGDDSTEGTKPTADPKTTVTKFLNNLNAQNLRGAYSSSQNPNWGSYESFSNPTSGFGAVRSVNVKNISTGNVGDNSATINATYDVVDKAGNTTALKVTFGLKNVNGEWKISSYNIN